MSWLFGEPGMPSHEVRIIASMLTSDFLVDFKMKTEAKWAAKQLDRSLYGFQIVRGTRWLPGLSDAQILDYERDLKVTFPPDYRLLLRHLNGTDRETVNIYGDCGEPHRTDIGVYSYPRDLSRVRGLLEEWSQDWPEISAVYGLSDQDRCVPIYAHRGILCRSAGGDAPVFSIMGDDAVLYESDLRSYLIREFLEDPFPWKRRNL
jgi:hypothetical protein